MVALPHSISHSGGTVVFKIEPQFGALDSLPERAMDHFNEALIFHLKDAAQRVIDTVRQYLVRLEEPAVKTGVGGRPIHGYDTGLMYVSLKNELVVDLLATGIFYELLSDEAKYWREVEFGHWMSNGQWWPGYHMLETAILENAPYIRSRCREAWQDAAIKLGAEARVPGITGQLGIGPG